MNSNRGRGALIHRRPALVVQLLSRRPLVVAAIGVTLFVVASWQLLSQGAATEALPLVKSSAAVEYQPRSLSRLVEDSSSHTAITASSDESDGDVNQLPWDVIEVVSQPSAYHHNFTPQLPPSAKKFCTAHDDPSMEVMEPYVPSGDPLELRNISVWIEECKQPVTILPFLGVKMYPQLKCGALKLWKSFLLHAVGSGVATHERRSLLDEAAGVTVEPPPAVVKRCLSLCLDSPCCATFTLERADASNASRHRPSSASFLCGLQYCDYTTAHHQRMPVETFVGYSYVVAYRREFRPSLVRQEWRLAVHKALPRVWRLDAQAAPMKMDFEVRAVAEHGTLFQPVRGVVRIRARCFGQLWANTTLPTSPTAVRKSFEGPPLDENGAAHFDTTSPDISLYNGVAISGGEWLPSRDVHQSCAGRLLQMSIVATISTIVPDEALATPLPDADNDGMVALSATLWSLVHSRADSIRLVFAPPEVPRTSAFGMLTMPSHNSPFHHELDHSCAPLLRRDECCLRHLWAKQESSAATSAQVGSPDFTADASTSAWEFRYVRLVAESVRHNATMPSRCVNLVDGFQSHFDEDGVARFTNLVIRVNRQLGECVADGVSLRLTLAAEFPQEDTMVFQSPGDSAVSIPMSWLLAGCGNPSVRSKQSSLKQAVPPLQASLSSTSSAPAPSLEESDLPILVSVPAHECLECLHGFLSNLRAFVWPSVVVIHFSSTKTVMPSVSELQGLNRSHPFTFVNRHRVDSVVGVRLLHIHGLNIHFAVTELPWVRFSHALMLASNELFVKHGTVEYIRQHDAVWMSNPTADSGALYEHHGDGRHKWTVQEFLTAEEMLRYEPRRWGFVWPDAIVADHWLAGAMRQRNITKHPWNTVLLEGTFFRRDIAVEFAEEIMSMFDPFDYCEEPMLYPHCEILGPTVFQSVCQREGVKCGHRVTTMLWLRPEWTATVDDVRRVRCSPCRAPFGFKRVPRSPTNPVRHEISQLTTQALVTKRRVERETNLKYCLNLSFVRI